MAGRVLAAALWVALSALLSAMGAPVQPATPQTGPSKNQRIPYNLLAVDGAGAVVSQDHKLRVADASNGRVRRVDLDSGGGAVSCLGTCDAFVASGFHGEDLVPDGSIVWGSVKGVRRERLPGRGAPLARALVLVANAPDDAVILASDLVSASTLVVRRPNESPREVAVPTPFGRAVVSRQGNRAVVEVNASTRQGGEGVSTRIWLERDSGGWTLAQPPEKGVKEIIACMSGDGAVVVAKTGAGAVVRPWLGRTGGQEIPASSCRIRGDRIVLYNAALSVAGTYPPAVVRVLAFDGTLDFTATLPGPLWSFDVGLRRFLVRTKDGFVIVGRQGELLERLPAGVDDAALTEAGQLVTVDRHGVVTWHR
jgi:hypothetical protein